MAKLTAPEKKLLVVCTKTLDSIIGKWSADIEADPEVVIDEKTRYRMKDRLMVDKAVIEMWAALLRREDNVFAGVEDTDPVMQKAYRHAVDAYFTIYLGATPASAGLGRPRTELKLLCKILELHRAKKKIKEICEAIHLDPNSPLHCDRVRKRLKVAEKRCTGKNSSE